MGRLFFGALALALGIASLALHAQLISSWTLPGQAVFVYATAIVQIAGGAALLVPRWARLGAVLLLAVYLVFACLDLPGIFAEPGVYASWGNVFYTLGLAAGAVVAFAPSSPPVPRAHKAATAAVLLFGLCNISYAIEQMEYFARSASLVPKWMPLGAPFWTVATTIAFALAGVALAIRYKALLASRLLAAMLIIFGVTIWIPMLIAQPGKLGNWSEGLETLALAGTAWMAADFLARSV